MKMTTNEVLARQNFITKVLFKDGDASLSKELKVKIMAMRIEYAKVRKSFDEDLRSFVDELPSDEFKTLQQKENRTDEEEAKLKTLTDQINEEYNEYVVNRGKEEVEIKNTSLTEDEFNQIVEVNAGNDVEINGQNIPSADFLEILYSLFVEE